MSHQPRLRLVIVTTALAAAIGCATEQPTSVDTHRLTALGDDALAAVGPEKQCAGVTVVPSADTISVGETLHLTGLAYDKHGKTLDKAIVAWSSLDTSTAAVSASGVVTGISAGTDTVVVRCSMSAVPGLSLITVH